jgi:hypothetical protein
VTRVEVCVRGHGEGGKRKTGEVGRVQGISRGGYDGVVSAMRSILEYSILARWPRQQTNLIRIKTNKSTRNFEFFNSFK